MNINHKFAVVRIDGPLHIVSTHWSYPDAERRRASLPESSRYQVMHYLPPHGVRQLTRAEQAEARRLFMLQIAVAE